MSHLSDWCAELLEKATGDPVPEGHTYAEGEYKWHAFASPGYRNNDVVNSMIAFFYEHGEIRTERNPWWASATNKTAVKEYMKWAVEHIDESDWSDVEEKARVIIPYIWRYREEPLQYLITACYFGINDWNKMNTEWKEGIR